MENQKKTLELNEKILLILQFVFILITIGFLIRLTAGELTIGNVTFIKFEIHYIILPITSLLAVFVYTWFKGLEQETIFYYLTIRMIIIPISFMVFIICIINEMRKSIMHEQKILKIDLANYQREIKEKSEKKITFLQRLKKSLPVYDTFLFEFSIIYIFLMVLAYPSSFIVITTQNFSFAIISLILVEFFFIGTMLFYFKNKIVFRVFSISFIIMGLIINTFVIFLVIIIILLGIIRYAWLYINVLMYHDKERQVQSSYNSLQRSNRSY